MHCLLIKLWSMQFPFPNQIPSSHSKGFQTVVQTCIWNLLSNLKYEGHLIFLLFSRNVGVPAPSIDFMSSSFHKIERLFLGRWRLGVGDRYVAPAQGHGRSLHSLSAAEKVGLVDVWQNFLSETHVQASKYGRDWTDVFMSHSIFSFGVQEVWSKGVKGQKMEVGLGQVWTPWKHISYLWKCLPTPFLSYSQPHLKWLEINNCINN